MPQGRASLLAWLLEQAPFGVAWCDGSGTVEVNAKGAELLGLHERRLDKASWAQAVRLLDSSGCFLEDPERPLSLALSGRTVPRTRLQVIVWRDKEGRLRYHGPPRWHEIEGLEEPRLVRAHDVTETVEEIVRELLQTDQTPTLARLNAGADWADD